MGRTITQYVGIVPFATPRADVSAVASSATAVTLLAARGERMAATIYNASTAMLYVKYGTAAALADFTYRLQPGQFWEMPTNPVYTGLLTGIWASANGSAMVTEVLE